MKKLLLMLVVAISFASCTKEGIKTEASKFITENVSKVIVAELECAQVDAVKADVKAQVDKLLKINAETSFGASFCNSMVDLAVPQLIKSGVPATWECTAATATANVVELAKKGCAKL